MQGSTYNSQQTAAVPNTTTYNPQQVAAISGLSTYNPQLVAQAAAIAQQQAQAAVVRAKEILRVQTQGQINSNTTANVQKIKTTIASPSWRGNLKVTQNKNQPKIITPQQTEYQKAYTDAYWSAIAEYDKKKAPGKQGFWQKVGDKLTFGQDRRDIAARKYAEEQAGKIQNTDFSSYENKINDYLKKQAGMQDAVNKAAESMTQEEFDKYIAEQQSIIDKEYKSLVDEGANYDAKQAAFDTSSKQPLTSFGAKTLGKTVRGVKGFASDQNPVWRFTLGNGWENVPSLVRAPSRVVNWVGNINTKDRKIFEYGGQSMNRAKTGKNAWQATYNQRNFNVSPVTDKPFDKKSAYKELQNNPLAHDFKNAKTDAEKEKIAHKYWDAKNKGLRNQNSAKEIASDPLILAGGLVKGAEAFGVTDKLSKFGRASKATAWAFKSADKLGEFKSAISESKAVKWLGKEHKTPTEVFNDTKTAVRDMSRAEQDNLLKKIGSITEKLKVNPKYDLSIFEDLKALSPKEREVLQRMSGDGKLSLRDSLLSMGNGGVAVRAKFEDLAKKYTAFTEEMKLADNVKTTRFGLGKKRIYSPKTAWADHLDNYNFRLFRKGRQVQNGEDFLHGVIDRFFKSNLDEKMVEKGGKYLKYSKELKSASGEYAKSFENAKQLIGDAKSQLRHDTTGVTGWLRNKEAVRGDLSFGRSIFNTAKKVESAPIRIWKKSVLNLRPAWTVNNALYNAQGGVLAGGFDALSEQAKMLNPKYWRKAMSEGAAFRSNIGKEIGNTGKLNKFYSGVEDWSRVAAGRAAVKKGLSEEQALGRVNKYLFDYKTSNWERPIKTAVPFWSFQKNLAKAAFKMPFDRPLAAITYNRIDKYQQNQYDAEFSKLTPELTKLGYTPEEINAIKEQNAKYFKGRLKIGNRWITTPFNSFSDKGLTNIGINPFLSAAQEAIDSKDSFGQTIKGKNSTFMSRLISKFPQIDIGTKLFQAHQVSAGKVKPSERYIGAAGSDGFGMGKEKQGYDPSKKNYVASMDPRNKLSDQLLAFGGVPKSMQFDTKGFIEGKKLQKVTSEYFALDTKDLSWADAEAKRKAIFDKYGISSDEFYKGVLSKFDTANTTKIKNQKEAAAKSNNALFAEYGAQPAGTRSAWAVKKLHELNASGYYKDNPFLYSFVKSPKNPKGFITPDSIDKSKKGQQKKLDYQYAMKTGDWSIYKKKYGVKVHVSKFKYGDKYFKSAESMAKYKSGEFWNKYANATPVDRKQLLKDNPEYNTRGNWTAAMWLADKKTKKAELKKRAVGFGNISKFVATNLQASSVKSTKFQATIHRRQKKVSWKLS